MRLYFQVGEPPSSSFLLVSQHQILFPSQLCKYLTNYCYLIYLIYLGIIGSLLHRGRGNDGHTHRFFYYASYAVDVDGNTEDLG